MGLPAIDGTYRARCEAIFILNGSAGKVIWLVPVKAEYSLSTSLCISLRPLETDWDLPDRGLLTVAL